MTPDTAEPQPETEPGIATGERGLVFLEGPDGVAATMTADAAARTGQNLIDAAAVAATQRASDED